MQVPQSPLRTAWCVAFGLMLAAPAASAQEPHMPTQLELAQMPEYCQAKMGSNQALHEQWRVRMGPQHFVHLHHYCHGLKHLQRASLASDTQKRRHQYERASAEFDYVIRNWPPEFPLRAQALQQQKMARTMQGLP
jgi:hypothetical protein